LLLAGIVVLGAIGFLVYRGLGNSVIYFKTADEAVASRAQLGTRDFRIEGVVVPGSVQPSGSDVSFTIASKGVQVPVTNQGSPPEMFQPNIPVVLQGHFAGQQFVSNQIMVKHSAVYIGQHPGRVTAPDGSSR
jgi:cytochrome c-type biogenesis protein CcmE